MRNVFPLFAALAMVLLWSCNNNNSSSQAEMEKQRQDSIHRADSMTAAANAERERTEYRARYEHSLDSMRASMNYADSMMTVKKNKEWTTTSHRYHTRMDSLRTRLSEGGAKADNDWQKFKGDMDTAGSQFRRDWNKLMDKMKIKKKENK